MGKVILDITMSLDGFIAGPNDGIERPMGDEGERLHDWIFGGKTDSRLPVGHYRKQQPTPMFLQKCLQLQEQL